MYRSNFYLSIIGNIVFFFIRMNIWQALYSVKGTINGIDLGQMMAYVIITEILSGISASNIAFTIADQVKDGTISNELAKPIDYKMLHVAREIGGNLLMTICITLPAAVLMAVLYDVSFFTSGLQVFLFLFSAVLGAGIMYTIEFLFGIMAFWFKTAEYSAFISGACRSLFSGAVVPLWFYPEFLYHIAMFLPFRFVTFEPISIFLGTYDTKGALVVLLWQSLWFIGLIPLERFLWKNVQKHLVIQGG